MNRLPNRPLDERGKPHGDAPSAVAILDRLLHRTEMIAVNGRSLRQAAMVHFEVAGDDIPECRFVLRATPESATICHI